MFVDNLRMAEQKNVCDTPKDNETVDVPMESASNIAEEAHMDTTDVAARPKLPPISGEMLSVRTICVSSSLQKIHTINDDDNCLK
jgi:hypothetical protein